MSVAEKFELHAEPPPNEVAMYQEDGQYLRVTLDKSQNMQDAAGARIRTMLVEKFGGDEDALRVWYRANVETWEGIYYEHREWEKVRCYLPSKLETDRAYKGRLKAAADKWNSLPPDIQHHALGRSRERDERNQGVTSSQLRNALNKGHDFDPTIDHEVEDWIKTYKAWPKAKQQMAAARIGLGPIAQA